MFKLSHNPSTLFDYHLEFLKLICLEIEDFPSLCSIRWQSVNELEGLEVWQIQLPPVHLHHSDSKWSSSPTWYVWFCKWNKYVRFSLTLTQWRCSPSSPVSARSTLSSSPWKTLHSSFSHFYDILSLLAWSVCTDCFSWFAHAPVPFSTAHCQSWSCLCWPDSNARASSAYAHQVSNFTATESAFALLLNAFVSKNRVW